MSDAQWIMQQQLVIKDAEIERLRRLLRELVDGSWCTYQHTIIPQDLFDKIEKEVSDE